ncbi:hypothetical protein GLW20_01690 [Virgibacillus halodenitrificans]|nr:hypothetical protein [Virgibacillus halodenitrificans]
MFILVKKNDEGVEVLKNTVSEEQKTFPSLAEATAMANKLNLIMQPDQQWLIQKMKP